MTQRCRVCGCSSLMACPGGCAWVEDDLCSSCDPDLERALSAVFGLGRNYPGHFDAVLAGDKTYVCPPPGCALDRPPAVTR